MSGAIRRGAAAMFWIALWTASGQTQTARPKPVVTEMSHYAMRWTPRHARQYGTRVVFAYPDRRYIGRWARITPLAPRGRSFRAACCGTMPSRYLATSRQARVMRVRHRKADLYTKGWWEKMPCPPSLAVVKIEWEDRQWTPHKH